MGYAQLAEGKVEKLRLPEELQAALDAVFPPGADYKTEIDLFLFPGTSSFADAERAPFRNLCECP